MVNFNVSTNADYWIGVIVRRAEKEAAEHDTSLDPVSLAMDLTAIHANGCPLKLMSFAAAEPYDFVHDIVGITSHIDRKTGKLTGCFLPRFALTGQQEEVA